MQELKQIQEENRKAVIMACNPEAKTYEEALEMELNNQVPCVVKIKYKPIEQEHEKLIFYTLKTETNDELIEMGGKRIHKKFMSRIIGGQLTLNRVLVALSDKLYQMDIRQEVYITNLKFLTMSAFGGVRLEETVIFEWNLTKETLEEQSEETQRKISKLLICKKKI